METPRHWRLRKQRLGNESGGLLGAVCPSCGSPIFPANRPVCPYCSGKMTAPETKKIEALGVGGLFFVKNASGQLELLLFQDVDDGNEDHDSKKLERLANQGQTKAFTRPKGFNTVTGKVDRADAVELMQINESIPVELQAILVNTLLKEISEEALGMVELTAQHIHYFSQSTIAVEQLRPIDQSSDEKMLAKFTVFVLAVLLNPSDIVNLERDYQLFSLQELKQLKPSEVRVATLATFDFIMAALLFLANEGKLQPEETNILSTNNQEFALALAN